VALLCLHGRTLSKNARRTSEDSGLFNRSQRRSCFHPVGRDR
jgi:hypothetical protein